MEKIVGYTKDGQPVRIRNMSNELLQPEGTLLFIALFGSAGIVISIILWEEWKHRKDPRVGHY